MDTKRLLPMVVASVAALGAMAGEVPGLKGPALTLWVENDAVFNTDRHYTHGSRVGYLDAEVLASDERSRVSWVSRRFPDAGLAPEAARFGIQLGQNLYTPTELHDPNLQLHDRPYAALLYGSLGLQRRGTSLGTTPTLDSWTLDLGIVGPGALGEALQNSVHRVDAAGWQYQLRNEPAVDLEWARIWRLSVGRSVGWSAQALPFAGVRAGTVQVYGTVGGQVRAGWAVPRDFGRQTIDDAAPETGGRCRGEDPSFHAYFLTGVEGRAVAWNMLLDGNIWHESPSVEKRPWVTDLKAGLVIGWKMVEVAYIHVFRSEEFRGQPEVDSFGSLAISVRW